MGPTKKTVEDSKAVTDGEHRFNETLKRMLKTPPKARAGEKVPKTEAPKGKAKKGGVNERSR